MATWVSISTAVGCGLGRHCQSFRSPKKGTERQKGVCKEKQEGLVWEKRGLQQENGNFSSGCIWRDTLKGKITILTIITPLHLSEPQGLRTPLVAFLPPKGSLCSAMGLAWGQECLLQWNTFGFSGEMGFKGILGRGRHLPLWGEESWADEYEGTREGKHNSVDTYVEYFPKCFNLGNFFLEGMVLNQRKMTVCNCGIHLWPILRAGKMYLEI